ncbi:MAG: RNA polymerase sigma factor RpoD, partial [Chloroflexi bacterium]|nr:RNA polymerase sigma factor RpoD [Chloroflexota bacterium]
AWERRVIEMRFGLGDECSRTLEEVGAELGLTKERIRQIEKEALTRLRHLSESQDLVDYLS